MEFLGRSATTPIAVQQDPPPVTSATTPSPPQFLPGVVCPLAGLRTKT